MTKIDLDDVLKEIDIRRTIEDHLTTLGFLVNSEIGRTLEYNQVVVYSEYFYKLGFETCLKKLANHESNTSPAQSQKATDELGTTSVRANNQNVCKCGHRKDFHEGEGGEPERPEGYCCYTEEDLITDCECNKFEPKGENP